VLTIWVFNFFWRKNFGAKAAHKILVKLTPARQKKTISTFQTRYEMHEGEFRLPEPFSSSADPYQRRERVRRKIADLVQML
jgi:hypothetical protein